MTGGCLCGAVRYRIDGPARGVIVCHCIECRRWHGHVCAATAVRREQLVVTGDTVRWFDSPESESAARRGFCSVCGSSLFWDAPELPTISIAAGTLDAPTGLVTIAHIHTATAGDYYRIPDDGLPRHRGGTSSPPEADGRA